MIRARFYVNADDPRPVNWPIKHPYWVTGYSDEHAVVVAYADDVDEIKANWPEAEVDDYDECTEYTFTDRFQKPEWMP